MKFGKSRYVGKKTREPSPQKSRKHSSLLKKKSNLLKFRTTCEAKPLFLSFCICSNACKQSTHRYCGAISVCQLHHWTGPADARDFGHQPKDHEHLQLVEFMKHHGSFLRKSCNKPSDLVMGFMAMNRWICHDGFPFSKFNSSSNFWERNSSFWRYQSGWWLRRHFSFSIIQHQNNVKSYLILLHHYHVQICFITIPPIIKPPPFVLPSFPPRAPWHV